jgi:hypothetical protein
MEWEGDLKERRSKKVWETDELFSVVPAVSPRAATRVKLID